MEQIGTNKNPAHINSGLLGSGVMSGTKILESKTIKNPLVWAERQF
jgi:hypothetical protein